MLRTIAILFTAVAVLWGIRTFYLHNSGAPSQPQLATPENSDYYMTGATVYQMNESGHLAYRMRLGETLHFPDDSAQLKHIDVHYRAGTKTYWDITAARGRVPPGERDIYLDGGVEGRHPRPKGTMVQVTTDNAWVRPEADRIETKAHVIATEPGQRVEGDGMEVDLKTDKLRLLENVQVTYTP